jgi:hypothetical protein
MRHFLSLVILIFAIASLGECNIVLRPTKKTDFQAGYIFFQGASIPAANYRKYAVEMQKKFNGSLWVGITEFPFHLPEPLLVNEVVNGIFNEMKKQGFNYNSQTPFLFGGHSLGGIIVQDYMLKELGKLPVSFAGLVLEGSFIRRSKLAESREPNFPPILTLGAELDGLARITRLAESFYHDYDNQKKELLFNKDKKSSYTIIIPGMNHYQFVGEGAPPSFVVKNDIEPEISNAVAMDVTTSLTVAFAHFQLNRFTVQDIELLSEYIQNTITLTEPIIDAFMKEGFYHFKPPCKNGLQPPNCFAGSSWSVSAQQYMGTVDSLLVRDEFHNIIEIPERFPSINNKCTPGVPCVLNVTAITMNVYTFLDKLDNGLEPVAASEQRTKMNSRQSILQAYTNQKYDFNQTDNFDLCGQINQKALDWALKSAPLGTVNRYSKKGKILKIGADIGPVNNGFLWVNSHLV